MAASLFRQLSTRFWRAPGLFCVNFWSTQNYEGRYFPFEVFSSRSFRKKKFSSHLMFLTHLTSHVDGQIARSFHGQNVQISVLNTKMSPQGIGKYLDSHAESRFVRVDMLSYYFSASIPPWPDFEPKPWIVNCCAHISSTYLDDDGSMPYHGIRFSWFRGTECHFPFPRTELFISPTG
jgi:hypothetical protein